jgi:PilZ domain
MKFSTKMRAAEVDMAGIERREHPRYNPPGLYATIKLGSELAPIIIQGEIVDISYNGVKIRMELPANHALDNTIKIELCLPDSETPLSIFGTLKHHSHFGELGFEYVDCPVVEALDSFMFECMKIAKA